MVAGYFASVGWLSFGGYCFDCGSYMEPKIMNIDGEKLLADLAEVITELRSEKGNSETLAILSVMGIIQGLVKLGDYTTKDGQE